MTSPNENFYQAIGATLDETSLIASFDKSIDIETATTADTICPLSHQAVLEILGPDSKSFLQGQLTCNLNELNQTQSALGAACTHKGRMYTSFRLVEQSANRILMGMSADVLAKTQATLAKYAVFSKAELTDLSEEYHLFGVAGPNAEQHLQSLGYEIPSDINQVSQNDEVTIVKINNNHCYEVWLPTTCALATWRKLCDLFQPSSNILWQLVDIRDGRGTITAPTVEVFIPQMLNYHLTNAVSFNKGCYTGQEIVARMQYRGKLKRHMYRGKIKSKTMVTAGDNLFSESSEQSAGTVVSAVKTGSNEWEMLFVATDGLAASNQLQLSNAVTANGEPDTLEQLALPYVIDSVTDSTETD